MAYTAGFSVSVGDPTKASDVSVLAANDDYLKAAVEAKATLSGDTNNYVTTITGANALVGEADLTFASNLLTVYGPDGSSAAGSAGVLNLSTRETGVGDADQLGRIDFQAPAETQTGDARLVTASIYAEADVAFDATNNATDLVLATAHDGAAAERFRVTSQGEIGLAGANYGTDGYVLTSAGAGAAAAWEAIPAGITLSGSTPETIATVTGANALQGEANLTFDGSTLAVTGAVTMANAAGPTIVNEAATATNPTLIPNKAEVDTGYGWAAADTLTAITGGTERMRIDSTGAVTKPTNPAFFVGTTDLLENVTGDGTPYTIIWPTEQFDSGDDDYDTSTGQFTAPVAGRYQFNSCVWMAGLDSSHTAAEIQLKTSDCPAIQFWYGNPYVSADSGHFAVSGSCIIDMDAADTAEMVLTVAHGTKVVDIGASGAANHPRAHFSGFLAT